MRVPLATISIAGLLNIYGYYLQDTINFQKKVSYLENIVSLTTDAKKKELSLLIGPETDITALSNLNLFANFKNITIDTQSKEIVNDTAVVENLLNHTVILLTDITKTIPLLNVKLTDFLENGGLLYTAKINPCTTKTQNVYIKLGTGINIFTKFLKGAIILKNTLFIAATKQHINTKNKTFFIGSPVDNCIIPQQGTNSFSSLIVNLGTPINTIVDNYFHYNINTNLKKQQSIFLPVISNWGDNKIFKSANRTIIKMRPVLKETALLRLSSILKLLHKCFLAVADELLEEALKLNNLQLSILREKLLKNPSNMDQFYEYIVNNQILYSSFVSTLNMTDNNDKKIASTLQTNEIFFKDVIANLSAERKKLIAELIKYQEPHKDYVEDFMLDVKMSLQQEISPLQRNYITVAIPKYLSGILLNINEFNNKILDLSEGIYQINKKLQQ